jgi:hypothetical protein
MLARTSEGWQMCHSEHMFQALVRVCAALLEAIMSSMQGYGPEEHALQPERRTLLQIYDAAQSFYWEEEQEESADGQQPGRADRVEPPSSRHYLMFGLHGCAVWADTAVWSGVIQEAMAQEQVNPVLTMR